MSTLAKIALGMMGRLRAEPSRGDAAPALTLPAAERRGGLPLMDALAGRRSSRDFAPDALPLALLSSLLWAAYAHVAAGAIAQNVYLFAAANGLATVIRAWIDRAAIAEALGLTHDQQVLLSQTVGYPKSGGA
jgi:nitroreductase